MTYLSLVTEDDGILVTAVVDDEVWNAYRGAIERAAYAAGYSTRVDNVVDGLHPSKACHTFADVSVFISDTAGWTS